MKKITTANELEEYFNNNLLVTVVDNVAERLLIELKEIINEVVYSYPEKWGGRTEQFRDSWERTKAEVTGSLFNKEVSAEIYQVFKTMIYKGEEWKHGNPKYPLVENQLNNIIEHGLKESHCNFPAIEARPFWSEFLKYVDENLDKIFKEECAKVGLNIQSTISYTT